MGVQPTTRSITSPASSVSTVVSISILLLSVKKKKHPEFVLVLIYSQIDISWFNLVGNCFLQALCYEENHSIPWTISHIVNSVMLYVSNFIEFSMINLWGFF